MFSAQLTNPTRHVNFNDGTNNGQTNTDHTITPCSINEAQTEWRHYKQDSAAHAMYGQMYRQFVHICVYINHFSFG